MTSCFPWAKVFAIVPVPKPSRKFWAFFLVVEPAITSELKNRLFIIEGTELKNQNKNRFLPALFVSLKFSLR
jgi:hypothetical protein